MRDRLVGALRDVFRGRGRSSGLVLSDSAATRSLVAIVAILTFLAGLAAVGAEIVSESSRDWRAAIGREATIQLRPRPGRDAEADLARAVALARAAPGIAEARPLPRAEAERLLEPWLGTGLDLAALPVPRLAVVKLAPGRPADLRALSQQIAAEIPGATLDDHAVWLERLSGIANAVLAVTAALMLLVLAAAALAVAFATRGAMAGSRETVDVLQLMGAGDRFIAREFAARFVALTLAAAAAGGGAALLVLPLVGILSGLGASERTGEAAAFAGSLSVGWRGYLFVALLAATVAALSGAVSVATAKRFLRELRAS